MDNNIRNYKELYKQKCEENTILYDKILLLENNIKDLTDRLRQFNVTEKTEQIEHTEKTEKSEQTEKTEKPKKLKGQLCSISGNNYEKSIHNIITKCDINNKKFNTQDIKELGGSSSSIDLQCNYINNKDIGIEVKKYNTPDWMQCCIIFDNSTEKWKVTDNKKIPDKSRDIFNNFIIQ